jgi:hypothetical protein
MRRLSKSSSRIEGHDLRAGRGVGSSWTFAESSIGTWSFALDLIVEEFCKLVESRLIPNQVQFGPTGIDRIDGLP